MDPHDFPSQPDWSTGRFYGPTSDAAGDFPANVYLNAKEWFAWQLNSQLKLNEAASLQFDAVASGFGFKMANPYTPYITQLKSQLGQ